MTAVTIDVVSDVVCPWCYIGKRRLDKALATRPDLEATVRFRPFQLDGTIPSEGLPRQEYMLKKFGDPGRIAATHERIREAGRQDGIDFAFDKIRISPNTLDCHRVIRWADEAGVQPAVKERLMHGFFAEGVDLSNRAEIARLAGEAGMVAAQVAEWLETEEDVEAIQAEVGHMQAMGISGVPFFVINNKIGVSGAQPPEVLLQAIDQALAAG